MVIHARNFVTSDDALGGSVIERSLRIDQGTADSDSGSNYSRTFASGNRKTFTFSLWLKKCDTPGNIGDGDDQYAIFTCGGGGTGAYSGGLKFNTSDQLIWTTTQPAPSTHSKLQTNRKFRDPSAWYHIVFVADTTQGTDSNRLKLYVNGVQETDFANTTYPSQNYDLYFNLNVQHRIGSNSIWSDLSRTYGNFNGYFAEFHFLDGTAYDPSYFGYTESQTGLWRPKKYTSGNYGTNGFYLDFIDNTSTTTLGLDKSGQGNNFTPEDVSVSAGDGNDSVEDTPTNNFPTFNTLDRSSDTKLYNGNLRYSFASRPNSRTVRTTFALPSTGKYYWEFLNEQSSSNPGRISMGVVNFITESSSYNTNPGTDSSYMNYSYGGGIQIAGSSIGTAGSWYNTERAAIAVDCDTGKFWFGKVASNGSTTWYNSTAGTDGNPATGTNPTTTLTNPSQFMPFGGWHEGGSGSEFFSASINFGQQAFLGTIPSGFKTLSTKNILPNVPPIIRPQKHFDSILYTGNGSTQSPSGLEFTPDFVWIKARSAGHSNAWFDSVRGVSKVMHSNAQNQEGSYSGLLTSFHRGGFTVGNYDDENQNSTTYVAWCWKAGGAAVTNNDGNITSSVSANQEAGFSVATYTGSTASGALTVGHGLGRKPAWVIIKRRDGGNHDWIIGHQGLATNAFANNKFVKFDNAAVYTNSQVFGAEPTTTVTQIVTDGSSGATNLTSSGTYVMYSWAEIPGYSKFGSYIGNGSSDGTYVHLGFRPAWVLIDNYGASGFNMVLQDNKRSPFNLCDNKLNPDSSAAEQTDYDKIDMLANGFKCRVADAGINASGSNYIYMAFAEQPGTTPFETFPSAR